MDIRRSLAVLFVLSISPNIECLMRPQVHPLDETEALVSRQSTAELIKPCNGSYWKTNGTTCGLKEIMIGRCYEYQYVKRGLFLSNQSATKDCNQLYQLFETAGRYKAYCNMNMSTYTDYFRYALDGVHVINRAIFWSGTYVIAHAYSGRGVNYITLEDTLAAGMADGLKWCGREDHPDGFDYLSCPNSCLENIWADLAFWGLASRTFAERVAGEIFVVLNGSRGDGRPSFRNNSFFSDFELPSFQRQGPYRVTKINVLLLHSPDLPVIEKCGEKSLVLLERLIRQSSFDYSCTDDPDELILLMCADDRHARECRIAREVLREQWTKKISGTSHASLPTLSWLTFLPLLLR